MLAVQVDVEELAVPQRLRHRVVERQTRHRLVCELGIETNHFRPFELLDERDQMRERAEEETREQSELMRSA